MMAARALCDEFRAYIGMHARDSLGGQPLAEYIFEWLEHGNAVAESGGDFGTYMQGVLFIIARWLEDPSFLNFEASAEKGPRTLRAVGLVEDLDRFEYNYAFDRDWFNSVIFRRLLERTSG
jgi:hypothetical protein